MKTPLLLLASSIPIALSAQPVLDFDNIGTVPGTSYIYHACPWQDPGSGGVDQTWDFSFFATDSIININFIDPALTPDAASFPTATIAAEDTGGIYAYSAFTASGGEFLGISLPGFDPIIYSDPITQVIFPCTYTTTWTDDFEASFTIGLPVTRTGTVTGTADGYGTLILPWGSITDVLRATYVEDYTDVNPFSTTTTHREYVHFMKAGTHYPLAHIYTYEITTMGGTVTQSGSQWMDALSTGISTPEPTNRVDVYPQPANEDLTIRSDAAGTLSVRVLDAQGRVVVERQRSAIDPRALRLDTRDLPAGMYTLRLVQGNAIHARPIVVTH